MTSKTDVYWGPGEAVGTWWLSVKMLLVSPLLLLALFDKQLTFLDYVSFFLVTFTHEVFEIVFMCMAALIGEREWLFVLTFSVDLFCLFSITLSSVFTYY